MRRDLERRLRAIEHKGSGRFEYWIYNRDGMVCSSSGGLLTREQAEARARAEGKFVYFASETDARL